MFRMFRPEPQDFLFHFPRTPEVRSRLKGPYRDNQATCTLLVATTPLRLVCHEFMCMEHAPHSSDYAAITPPSTARILPVVQ